MKNYKLINILFLFFSIILIALKFEISFAIISVNFFGDQPQKPLVSPDTGSSWKAAVIIEKANFLAEPGSDTNISEPPKFLEVVTLYKHTKDKRYFLVKRDSGRFGWMKESDILINAYCLKSLNPDNPAFLKIVVKNNWRLKKGLIEEIPFRSGPTEQYPVIGKVNIFKIRYAFKVDINRKYIFVGSKFLWNDDAPATCLKGWIDNEYCIAWDSQVAVFYKKSNIHSRLPVFTFRTQKDLHDFINSGNDKTIPPTAISIEDTSVTYELEADTTRFPVIDNEGDFLEISFVGDSIDQETEKKYSRRQIDRLRGVANRSMQGIRKIDLMFVLDATKSMGKYFRPVAEGINSFINDQSEKDKKRFKIGFAVYRDHEDDSNSFELICNIGSNNFASKLIEYADKAYSNDYDYPEAVYEGIYNAVKSASWRKGSTRAVIVIGDHGNHMPLKTEVGIKQVLSVIKRNRVLFYALNVNLKKNTQLYSNQFQSQMIRILDSNKQMGSLHIIASGNAYIMDSTRMSILNFLEDIFNISTDASVGLKEVSQVGKSLEKVRAKYGVIVTNYMLELMKEKGVSIEDIRMSQFNQFCVNGWVSKFSINRSSQLDSFFLINRQKFDMLVGMLAKILSTVNTHGRLVQGVIKAACESATGDEVRRNETISEYFQRIFWIPYRELSPSLQYTPYDLQNKLGNGTFKKRFLKDLNKKYEFLHMIQENKFGELKWNKTYLRYEAINLVSKEWWFVTSSGVRFCWVPFEYLP